MPTCRRQATHRSTRRPIRLSRNPTKSCRRRHRPGPACAWGRNFRRASPPVPDRVQHSSPSRDSVSSNSPVASGWAHSICHVVSRPKLIPNPRCRGSTGLSESGSWKNEPDRMTTGTGSIRRRHYKSIDGWPHTSPLVSVWEEICASDNEEAPALIVRFLRCPYASAMVAFKKCTSALLMTFVRTPSW